MTDLATDGPGVSDEPTYDLSAVDEPPRLANRSDVQRALDRNYPPLLRDAGITGDVSIRIRVLSSGRVDPDSMSIERLTHDAFNDPAFRSAERMRFAPGKVAGAPVHVILVYPLQFRLS
jgi:periplasmic protein TonB